MQIETSKLLRRRLESILGERFGTGFTHEWHDSVVVRHVVLGQQFGPVEDLVTLEAVEFSVV